MGNIFDKKILPTASIWDTLEPLPWTSVLVRWRVFKASDLRRERVVSLSYSYSPWILASFWSELGHFLLLSLIWTSQRSYPWISTFPSLPLVEVCQMAHGTCQGMLFLDPPSLLAGSGSSSWGTAPFMICRFPITALVWSTQTLLI